MPLADHIIILGEDGKIAEQGSWEDLRAEAGYISQIVMKDKHHDSEHSHDRAETREKIQLPTAKKSNQDIDDLTRKTGDITLYGM